MIRINKIIKICKTVKTTSRTSISEGRQWHFLAIMFSGEYEHYFGTRTMTARKDTVMLFNKKDPYKYDMITPGVSVNIVFDGEMDEDSFFIDASANPYVNGLFQKITTIKNIRDPENYYICMQTAYQILACVAHMQSLYSTSEKKQKILPAYNYIMEHYTERDISVRYLAGLCELSEKYFSTLFKNEYQLTPNQFIISKRLEEAAILLRTDIYTVTQIAEMTGFCDVYYFSESFKKHMNMSPLQYKKSQERIQNS